MALQLQQEKHTRFAAIFTLYQQSMSIFNGQHKKTTKERNEHAKQKTEIARRIQRVSRQCADRLSHAIRFLFMSISKIEANKNSKISFYLSMPHSIFILLINSINKFRSVVFVNCIWIRIMAQQTH